MQTRILFAWRSVLSAALISAAFLTGCAPPGARALLQGEALIEKGKFKEALVKLERASKILERHPQAWNYLGLAHHHLGNYREAARAYEQALARDPNLAAARLNLGELYLERKDYESAISELTSYTALAPDDGDGWMKLARARLRSSRQAASPYLRDRDLAAADVALRNAVQLGEDVEEALNDLGVILAQRGKPREAWRLFDAVLRENPNHSSALLNLAILYDHHLLQPRLALQTYEKHLQLYPNSEFAAAIRRSTGRLHAELEPSEPPPTVAETKPAPQPPPKIRREPPEVVKSEEPTPVAPPEDEKPPDEPFETPAPSRVAENSQPAAPASDQPAEEPQETPDQETAPSESESIEIVEIQVGPQFQPALDAPPPPLADEAFAGGVDDSRELDLPPPSSRTADGPSDQLLQNEELDRAVASRPQGSQPSGLLNRLDPRTWFADETPAPSRRLEGTGADRPARLEPVGSPASRSRPTPPNRSRPKIDFPRYSYQRPAPPQSGDRVEANRHFQDARRADAAHRLAEAIEAYRRAVAADPEFFEAYYNLGLAAFRLKDWPLALSAYEHALAIAPSDPEARFNFALALEQAGYPVDAAQELETLARQNSADAQTHFLLAALYARPLQEPEEAERHYRKVLELNPQHAQAREIRYWLRDNP